MGQRSYHWPFGFESQQSRQCEKLHSQKRFHVELTMVFFCIFKVNLILPILISLFSIPVCLAEFQSAASVSSLYGSIYNKASVHLVQSRLSEYEIYDKSLQKISSENFYLSLKALNNSGSPFKTSTTNECLRDLTIIFSDIHPKSATC